MFSQKVAYCYGSDITYNTVPYQTSTEKAWANDVLELSSSHQPANTAKKWLTTAIKNSIMMISSQLESVGLQASLVCADLTFSAGIQDVCMLMMADDC